MARISLRSILACAGVLTDVIALPAIDELSAQRRWPAEEPWSGQAQCMVVAKWAHCFDDRPSSHLATRAAAMRSHRFRPGRRGATRPPTCDSIACREQS